MSKNPILPAFLCVSTEPAFATALYDLLRKRRGALVEVRRFNCAADPDLSAFHGRFVFTCKRVVALEAIAVGASDLGGAIWLAHSLEEVEAAGTDVVPYTREEIARIIGDRR